MKASNALIAWNGADCAKPLSGDAPPGSIAVGPLLQQHGEPDWTAPYAGTGGAAYVDRRTMSGFVQQHHVMLDWYMLVYTFGIHPYVAHRAFLLIDEYVAVIKRMGCGPAKDEPCHDPDVGYGRSILYPLPDIKVFQNVATHVWPAPNMGVLTRTNRTSNRR